MSVTMGRPVATRRMNTPRLRFPVHFGWFPGEWTVHVDGTPRMNTSSARIGYARVSTADQNLDAQIAALKKAGCTMIRAETGDGATLAGRPELGTILDFIHPGETLVVTRIDRLARSMRDLQTIVATPALACSAHPGPGARSVERRTGEHAATRSPARRGVGCTCRGCAACEAVSSGWSDTGKPVEERQDQP